MPNDSLKHIDTLFKKIVSNPYNFVSIFFPGLVIFEIIFNKGLINGGINTVYDFLIFILWIVGLSSPFLIISIISHYIHVPTSKGDNENDEENHEMLIPQIFILLILYVIFYKLLLLLPYSTCLTEHFCKEKYLMGIITFIIIGFLGKLIGKIYYKYLQNLIDEIKKTNIKGKEMTEKCPICEKSSNIKHWTVEAANNSLHYSECSECGKFKYNLHAFNYIENLEEIKKKALVNYIKCKNDAGIIPDFNFTNYPIEFYDKLIS